jgi:hypothetical protein
MIMVVLRDQRRMTMQNENSILLALKRIPWNKGKLPTGTFETLEDGTMIPRKQPCTCKAVEAIPEAYAPHSASRSPPQLAGDHERD